MNKSRDLLVSIDEFDRQCIQPAKDAIERGAKEVAFDPKELKASIPDFAKVLSEMAGIDITDILLKTIERASNK